MKINMKHLKTYEMIEDEPQLQIGEYVVCNFDFVGHWPQTDSQILLTNFIATHVGKYIGKDTHFFLNIIRYYNIPYSLKIYFSDSLRYFSDDDIKYHSINKKDCKMYLTAKMYNL